MRQKQLETVIKKLKTLPVSTLNGEELVVYFEYRLNKLLSGKRMLVRRELEYLIGETGRGNLRIDPELISHLTKEELFTDGLSKHLQNSDEGSNPIENILVEKQEIQKKGFKRSKFYKSK